MQYKDDRDRLEAIAEYARNVVTIVDQPRRDTPAGEAMHAASFTRGIDLLREALDSRSTAAEEPTE